MRRLVDANLSQSYWHRSLSQATTLLTSGMSASFMPLTANTRMVSEGDRVVVNADSDFPTLMPLRGGSSPSVALLRGVAELTFEVHAQLLGRSLPVSATTSIEGPSSPSRRLGSG